MILRNETQKTDDNIYNDEVFVGGYSFFEVLELGLNGVGMHALRPLSHHQKHQRTPGQEVQGGQPQQLLAIANSV